MENRIGRVFQTPTDHSDHCNGNFYLRAAFKMATQRNSAGTGDRTYGNCSSFDEIAVTLFITGPSVITIPKKMWDGIRLQIEPTIAALSVILVSVLIVGFVLTTLGQMIKAARHHHAK